MCLGLAHLPGVRVLRVEDLSGPWRCSRFVGYGCRFATLQGSNLWLDASGRAEWEPRASIRDSVVVRRMLDPDHATKAERLQAALAVLGKHLVIAVQDAA